MALSPNSTCELLLSDSRGQYIPRDFYNDFIFPAWGLDKEKFPALADPENEWYWEAWDELLNKAEWTDPDTGHKWRLWQDGDLFMIRDDHAFEANEFEGDDECD